MSEHKPAEVFPPGEYIREELVGRFAYHTGIGMDNAEAILRGERPMTEREIRMTAAYFGTRPEVWDNLNRVYEQHRTFTPQDRTPGAGREGQ